MGKLIHLPEGNRQKLTRPEYLRHFGISYCPFSQPGSLESFWKNHSVDDLTPELTGTMLEAGLVVISEPVSMISSPARDLILSVLDEDAVMADLQSLPETPEEFLSEVLKSFGFESIDAELSECRSVMGAFLGHSAHTGKIPVVMLQYSSPCSEAVADEIGRLLNFRENGQPCIRLVMLGKPESIQLNDVKLSDLPLSHLELEGLDKKEVGDFIFDRLGETGLKGRSLFTQPAIAHIANVSGGVPGVVSRICAAAMQQAFDSKQKKVTKAVLSKALKGFALTMPEATTGMNQAVPASGTITDLANDSVPAPDHEQDDTELYPYFDLSRDGKKIARFRLEAQRLTIGRHKSNEIYVPSAGVSLFHAVVIREGGQVFIFDLRSTNGTSVNGRDIAKKRLAKGDLVVFGALQLRYFPGSAVADETASNVLNFAETVVLEEKESSEPTVYFRGKF